MNTIVMNTLNAAVTEHDLPFTSITPGYAGSASGLFAIGGDKDDTVPIDARVVLPVTDLGSNMRKAVPDVYFALQGPRESQGVCIVQVMSVDEADQEVVEEFLYDFPIRAGHVSRAKPGRGIRANRLGLGYANADGAAFRLKGIEPEIVESKTRRLG